MTCLRACVIVGPLARQELLENFFLFDTVDPREGRPLRGILPKVGRAGELCGNTKGVGISPSG